MRSREEIFNIRNPEDGVCENCGCRDCAEYVEAPYTKEMTGKTVMVWLCADCYNSEVDGI